MVLIILPSIIIAGSDVVKMPGRKRDAITGGNR